MELRASVQVDSVKFKIKSVSFYCLKEAGEDLKLTN
jgi:hypothetical protein